MIALFLDSNTEDIKDCTVYRDKSVLLEDFLFGIVTDTELLCDIEDAEIVDYCKQYSVIIKYIKEINKVEDCEPVETAEEQPIIASDVVEELQVKPKQKQGLFSKLQSKFKKSQEVESLNVVNLDYINSVSVLDMSNRKTFIDYLVDNKYLTQCEVNEVESYISYNKKHGRNIKFIQACVQKNVMSSDVACEVLSKCLNKEVCSIENISLADVSNLMKGVYDLSSDFNFFIIKIDYVNKVLYIGQDLDSKMNFYKIEHMFSDFRIVYKYFLEGTTLKVLCAI